MYTENRICIIYLSAPGLPGKAAPATAAALLYDHILAALAAAQP